MELIARWTNGLGEEMTSPIYSCFNRHGEEFVVVFDWRGYSAQGDNGFRVFPRNDVTVARELVSAA